MSTVDYLLTPKAIRERTAKIYDLTQQGQGQFRIDENQFEPLVDFVLSVIQDKYPDLNIPYHSRWGHFRAGSADRLDLFYNSQGDDKTEIARQEFELVITSVLLDAGAGPDWKYIEDSTQKSFARSEGLAIASYYQFLHGELKGDAETLKSYSVDKLKAGFQVSDENPMVGLEGRTQLIKTLGEVIEANPDNFVGNRLGGLVDRIEGEFGRTLKAENILNVVLRSLGGIWPGRITLEGVNLGDVWAHSALGEGPDSYVPFHKLSQWLTYSLIEPLENAGFTITDLDGMTGLPEYRNGGLFVDKKLIQLKDESLYQQKHSPGSELVIEWRALTVQLLDRVANEIQRKLNKTKEEFPLAKVLEGGTWWAGRKIASELRSDGTPPIKIKSDGTVF